MNWMVYGSPSRFIASKTRSGSVTVSLERRASRSTSAALSKRSELRGASRSTALSSSAGIDQESATESTTFGPVMQCG